MYARIEDSSFQALLVQKANFASLKTSTPKFPGAFRAWMFDGIACQKNLGRNQTDRSRSRVIEMNAMKPV